MSVLCDSLVQDWLKQLNTYADDAMAILAAFNWSEVEVIGITTLFGNVPVQIATENALILRDMVSEWVPSGAHTHALSESTMDSMTDRPCSFQFGACFGLS